MSAPACPHCRERMSSIESGAWNIWTCLYCEGQWLPASQVIRIADEVRTAPGAADQPVFARNPALQPMLCPACASESFESLSAEGAQAWHCLGCGSAFFPKRQSPGVDVPRLLHLRFGDEPARTVEQESALLLLKALAFVAGNLVAL